LTWFVPFTVSKLQVWTTLGCACMLKPLAP
jgi:hypothetical protein